MKSQEQFTGKLAEIKQKNCSSKVRIQLLAALVSNLRETVLSQPPPVEAKKEEDINDTDYLSDSTLTG